MFFNTLMQIAKTNNAFQGKILFSRCLLKYMYKL